MDQRTGSQQTPNLDRGLFVLTVSQPAHATLAKCNDRVTLSRRTAVNAAAYQLLVH